MARYKLSVPLPGTMLYGDGDGDQAMVADTHEQARELWEEWTEEPQPFLHSYIGSCRVVYKRDIDGGDCHEDAEPGDTTLDYLRDDGRELRPHEVRVWMLGPPPVDWRIESLPPEPVAPDEIPIGTSVHHKRLGSGRTVSRAHHLGGRRWMVDVDFGWPKPQRRLACSVTAVGFMPSRNWPPRRVRLTVAGDVIAEGVTESTAEVLRGIRVARLEAEWEASAFDGRLFAADPSSRQRSNDAPSTGANPALIRKET
jgi:hypothetical protein